jgi:PadR family transcriptional regulator PadR
VCVVADEVFAMQAGGQDDGRLWWVCVGGRHVASGRFKLAARSTWGGTGQLTGFAKYSTFPKQGTFSENMAVESKLAPIRKGLLEFLVLKIVGVRSVYVPDILRRLAGTEFATQEGTLYPLLSKLRREELVLYEWKESDAGPPRKYYRLTDAGREQLAALDEYWTQINRTIADIGH